MRHVIFALTLFLAAAEFSLRADSMSAPAAPPPHDMAALSFLTLAQQEQYAKARAKALADNPALKDEGDQILAQGQTASTPADKQNFMEKMNSHRQKLRAAMLGEDPTLGPVFTAIDKHISELKAQAAISGSPSPSGSVSPASSGTNSH